MSERGRARRKELDRLRNESDMAWTSRTLAWSRAMVAANMPALTSFQREVLARQVVIDVAKQAGRNVLKIESS